ncbi:hypothetical protein AAG906_015337 [Vitis piasezkii]
MVAHFDMELEQMDVKTMFFYGEIEKTIYMRQPNCVGEVWHESSKPVSTPLAQHFKMTIENSPKTEKEVKYMEEIPCASIVGNIMYIMISRFMSNLGKKHWNAVKWVLRFLKGSTDVGILYGGGAVGELGVVVSLQSMVILSSIEVEYVALTESLWVKGMIVERRWSSSSWMMNSKPSGDL